jgi:SAM-dependent methyltransferase
MDYNELIGVVRETNRPPGGFRSVAAFARAGFVLPTSKVLEVGTSTGFTAVELAQLVGCRITAIDINEESLLEARQRAERRGVEGLISFERRDATATGLPDDAFDHVFCGNVTSLVADRDAALREYRRLLRPGGFLAALPMYYVETPGEELLAAVSAAIQVPIIARDKDFWVNFFAADDLTLQECRDYRFVRQRPEAIDSFADMVLAREHLQALAADVQEELGRRYREYLHLFNDNLSLMGFSVLLTQMATPDFERELFTSQAV